MFKVSASQKFETVVKFLRKKLDCKNTDSVFCYVNSVFAPGLDEGIGGLWRVSGIYSINYTFRTLINVPWNSVSKQTINLSFHIL